MKRSRTQDLRIQRLFYGRALKMGLLFSFIGSVALLTAIVILWITLHYLGVFEGLESILTYYPINMSTKTIALSALALVGAVFVLLELTILIFVYFFNLSSALFGGIVVTFETRW